MDPSALRLARWQLIADKIAADPVLLSIPLANIERWRENGQDAVHRLEEWRTRIEAAQQSQGALVEFLNLLRSDTEATRQLKSYSPFPGILTSEEVDRFRCAYQH
ncbi:MAG: hypothetical protein GWQ05_28380 [Verrucomicrobiaceae bacterium]|nr:hypothetical protein [Verrucomicrobiaceae bacterium]